MTEEFYWHPDKAPIFRGILPATIVEFNHDIGWEANDVAPDKRYSLTKGSAESWDRTLCSQYLALRLDGFRQRQFQLVRAADLVRDSR